MITDNSETAQMGVAAGINRIGVDLESIGKEDRQAGLNSRISAHTFDDFRRIRESIGEHPSFVRINSIHNGSAEEIETVIDIGATHIMLPYFHKIDEVITFIELVAGRAYTILLVETAAAVYFIEDIVNTPGIDEIHIGLTDLKISLDIPSRFETLTNWMIDHMGQVVKNARLPFCVGGITCIDDTSLPIPGEMVIAQYPRFRGAGALVTRAFLQSAPTAKKLAEEVKKVRRFLNDAANLTPEELEHKRIELKQFIRHQISLGNSLP